MNVKFYSHNLRYTMWCQCVQKKNKYSAYNFLRTLLFRWLIYR